MDLGNTIRLYVELGQIDRAQALAEEVRSHKLSVQTHSETPKGYANLCRRASGRARSGSRSADSSLPATSNDSPNLAVKRGDFQLEAEVRLRAAKQALHEGRHEDAAAQADKALTFYRSVGATRYIREAEALLAASPVETAPPTPQPRA
jgi:hypothetical protein